MNYIGGQAENGGSSARDEETAEGARQLVFYTSRVDLIFSATPSGIATRSRRNRQRSDLADLAGHLLYFRCGSALSAACSSIDAVVRCRAIAVFDLLALSGREDAPT